MLPQFESEVRSVLGGIKGITNVRVEGANVRAIIHEILKEEFASLRKNRLTWRRDQYDAPADPSLQVGRLRKDGLSYIGPFGQGRYYVQNGDLLMSNGELADWEKISDEKPVDILKDGRKIEGRSDKQLVKEIFQNFIKTALALDPNLCPYCARVSPASRKDYMKHVYQEHPDEFMADAEGEDQTRMDLQAEAHGQAPVPPPLIKDGPRRGPGRPPNPPKAPTDELT